MGTNQPATEPTSPATHSTSPAIHPITRRTIATGAAWAAPVIAVSTAAPALAASQQKCPVVPSQTAWTGPVYTDSGQPNTGQNGWVSYAGKVNFGAIQDAKNDSGTTFGITITAQISNLVVGATYSTSTINIGAGWGTTRNGVRPPNDPLSTNASVIVGLGPTTGGVTNYLFQGSTRPKSGYVTLQTSSTDLSPIPYPATAFTATATTMLLTVTFIMDKTTAATAGPNVNDDLFFYMPTFNCVKAPA